MPFRAVPFRAVPCRAARRLESRARFADLDTHKGPLLYPSAPWLLLNVALLGAFACEGRIDERWMWPLPPPAAGSVVGGSLGEMLRDRNDVSRFARDVWGALLVTPGGSTTSLPQGAGGRIRFSAARLSETHKEDRRYSAVTRHMSWDSSEHAHLVSERGPRAAAERAGPRYAASPEADPGRLRPGPCGDGVFDGSIRMDVTSSTPARFAGHRRAIGPVSQGERRPAL